MLFLPFTPARQQERVDPELGALEWSRNGRRNRLLPAAASFAIFENFIPADDAIGIEMERSSPGFGPEHEGRIAVPSPSDSDWAVRHLVLYHAVLRQIRRRVSLRNVTAGDPNQNVAVGKECGLGSGHEPRMVDSGIRHELRFRGLPKGGTCN
jgi:hypothetical protein